MGKYTNTISRQEAVLQAAVALAEARQKAARIYERLIAGEELYLARRDAHEVTEYITKAITLAWAFTYESEEVAAFLREAHEQAAHILARWEAEKVEDGEVPF